MQPIDSRTLQTVDEPKPDLSRSAFRLWLESQPQNRPLGISSEGDVLQAFVASQGFAAGKHGWDAIHWQTEDGLRHVYAPVYLYLCGSILTMRYYGHRPGSHVTAADVLAVLDEIPDTWDHLENNREARTATRALHTGQEWERWYDAWLDAFGSLRTEAIRAGQPYADVEVLVTIQEG